MRAYLVAFASLVAVASATPAAAEGFRAEIHAGWDGTSVGSEDDSGIVYGVGLGYDVNLSPNIFAGVDLSFDDSSQKECETSVFAANDRLCLKAGRDLAAAVRLGYNISEQAKVYALAGYTNARFKSTYTEVDGDRVHDAENLDGFRLGAGFQHALTSNTYGKVEYRYSNYEAGVERHQALVGLGINF